MNYELNVSPETIKELKGQHGEISMLQASDDEHGLVQAIVRKPQRADISRYTKTMTEKDLVRAGERLIERCLLIPEMEQLRPVMNSFPMLSLSFAQQLVDMASFSGEVIVKKL